MVPEKHPLLIRKYQGPVESMKVLVWSILLGFGVPEVSGKSINKLQIDVGFCMFE
jgi:hypothetical protein